MLKTKMSSIKKQLMFRVSCFFNFFQRFFFYYLPIYFFIPRFFWFYSVMKLLMTNKGINL